MKNLYEIKLSDYLNDFKGECDFIFKKSYEAYLNIIIKNKEKFKEALHRIKEDFKDDIEIIEVNCKEDVKKINEEIKNRYELFVENNCANIYDFRDQGNNLKFKLVIIEDIDKLPEEIYTLFTKSRASGIYYMIFTDNVNNDKLKNLSQLASNIL